MYIVVYIHIYICICIHTYKCICLYTYQCRSSTRTTRSTHALSNAENIYICTHIYMYIPVPLVNEDDEINARIIKGCLERTTLGQVAKYIKKVYSREGCTVVVKLDEENIRNLQLKINSSTVLKAIVADPKGKYSQKSARYSIYSIKSLWS